MFGKLKKWVEEHPYLSSAAAIVLTVGLYLLFHRGQGQAATSTDAVAGAGAPATNAYDVQMAQLQAGLAQTQLQTQAATQIAQLQSDTQNQQVNDQLAAVLEQQQTQLAATQSTNETNLAALQNTNQTQLAGLQASTAATLAGLENTNATQLAGLENTNATQVSLATVETGAQTAQQSNLEGMYSKIYGDVINAGVTENAQNDALQAAQTQTHANLITQAINSAPVGSGRYGNQLNELIQSIEGEQGSLTAAYNSQGVASMAQAMEVSNIVGSVASGIGSLAGGVVKG